ncbi:MAG TPA: hypothetical protein VKU82_06585 [Planctomycetaceae bacterium]|nr:hypothetical protein [Planctomycetaceae bacterium]
MTIRRLIFSGRRSRWGLCVLGLALAVWGCSEPTQIERDNRRLLDALLTAITMKNSHWLEDHAALAEKRREAGHLTEWEYVQLSSIIEKGRSGDWQAAEKKAYEFRKEHPFVKEGQ